MAGAPAEPAVPRAARLPPMLSMGPPPGDKVLGKGTSQRRPRDSKPSLRALHTPTELSEFPRGAECPCCLRWGWGLGGQKPGPRTQDPHLPSTKQQGWQQTCCRQA